MKYAIKYLKVRYIDDIYILIPKSIIRGDIDRDYFATAKEVFEYITNDNMEGKYIVGDAFTMDELRTQYQCGEEYTDKQVREMFFEDQAEKLSIVKDGRRILLDTFEMFVDNDGKKVIYQKLEGENCVLLNQKIIEQLMDMSEDEVKEYLRQHSDRIANFEEESQRGVQYILEVNGERKETGRLEDSSETDKIGSNVNLSVPDDNSGVSVRGLYEFLKQRIMGHDKELKWISTIMIMNYMSNPYYGTESILVPGPTGTGKTATFKCVSDYFNLPFLDVNVCNLVPEGIVGTTVEDEFSALIDGCGGDVKKAEKAILAFDEFDKIGIDGLDIKQSLINVFLKVLEGGRFPINRQMRERQIYNTGMASKACLGTFEQAFRKEKKMGFRADSSEPEIVFDKNLIVSRGYFTKELLSRIEHFIPYGEISDENKKRIILESKLSTYMMKKERLENQFGIKVDGDQEFALGVMDALKKVDQSVRDINNIIASVFLDIEYEILDNLGSYKKLTLSRSTPSDGKFDLR